MCRRSIIVCWAGRIKKHGGGNFSTTMFFPIQGLTKEYELQPRRS
jgi:hypothetical protein